MWVDKCVLSYMDLELIGHNSFSLSSFYLSSFLFVHALQRNANGSWSCSLVKVKRTKHFSVVICYSVVLSVEITAFCFPYLQLKQKQITDWEKHKCLCDPRVNWFRSFPKQLRAGWSQTWWRIVGYRSDWKITPTVFCLFPKHTHILMCARTQTHTEINHQQHIYFHLPFGWLKTTLFITSVSFLAEGYVTLWESLLFLCRHF